MGDTLPTISRIIIDTSITNDNDFYIQIVAAAIAKLNDSSSVITLRADAGSDIVDTDVLVYDAAYRTTMDISDDALANELLATHYDLLVDPSPEFLAGLYTGIRREALSFYSVSPESPPMPAVVPTALIAFAKNNIGVRYSTFAHTDKDNTYTYLERIVSFMAQYISHVVYTYSSNMIDTHILESTWDDAIVTPGADYYVSFPIPLTVSAWDTLATRIRSGGDVLFVIFPDDHGYTITPVTYQRQPRVEFPKTWQSAIDGDITSLVGVSAVYRNMRPLKRETVTTSSADDALVVARLALGINPVG